MNNVSIDEVLKRPLSSVENGSIKKNSSTKSTSDNIDNQNLSKTAGGMSKDTITINTATDNNTEDGDGSEAETVVMPGKELESASLKKTIRHEGNLANTSNGDESRLKTAGSLVLQNGTSSSTKPSRSTRQTQEGTNPPIEKKKEKKDDNGLSLSSHNSPSTSSPSPSTSLLNDQSQDQQHLSKSRATSESTRSRHENSDTGKPTASNTSRKRKVSTDGTEDKSAKRRIKREDNDNPTNTTEARKSVNHARSESPSRHRTSTGSLNSPNIQKPRRNPPPPLIVATGSRRKQSIDNDSNDSQSPKHSAYPRLTHATDSEMFKKRRDKNGRTRVARACAVDNLEEVRDHLKDHPEELDEPDNAGNTPLQIASLEGNTEIVKLLLKKGCKVETENCDRDSPLIDSVENSHLAVVRLLLEAGVNPRKVNAKGEEPSELVDLDHEDGPTIREELAKYRVKYESKRRQSTEKGPDTGRDSVSARSPRGSPSLNARSPPPQTTRRRAGRGEATRNDLLWITATPENLVNFAGKGDDQAIMHLLNMRPISDVEAILAAAKGGHDSCLNLLLAMGRTDPDPPPLEDQKKGYNTPMLAAIGKGTPRIVELLLEQPGFDPTRRLYKNQTYFEIAEKRQGDGWKEEYSRLKTAYDEKMNRDGKKRVTKSSRTSSPKDLKKVQKDHSPSATAARDSSPSASRTSITRKKPISEGKIERLREKPKDLDFDIKPDRKHLKVPKHESREGSNAVSDREASPVVDREKRSASDHEALPRPRKRLVSGRDLKDAQSKQRRNSFVSTISTSSAPDSVKFKSSPDESSKIRRLELDGKREKKKARRSVSPQPSDTSKANNSNTRRPRINSDSIASKSTSGSVKTASMTRTAQSSSAVPTAVILSTGIEKKDIKSSPKGQANTASSKDKGVKVDSDEKSKVKAKEKSNSKPEALKADPDKRRAREPKSHHDKPRVSQMQEISESTPDAFVVSKIKQELAEPSSSKESIPDIKSKKLASRSISPDPSAIVEDDAETAPTESGSVGEVEKVTPQPDKMDSTPDETLNEKKRVREQEEAIEEAERRKRKREADETYQRQAAQELKQKQERQRYLNTLPKVFKHLMEKPEEARTLERIQRWLPMVCATGVEVDSDCPETEREELWITNFQVAALLVESDLEMAHYTAWTRKPLVDPLKKVVWRNMRSMVDRWSILDSADILNGCHPVEAWDAGVICEAKWLALHTFWIRLSDFEDVVSRYPHLHGVERTVKVMATVRSYQEHAEMLEARAKATPNETAWRNFPSTPKLAQPPSESADIPSTQAAT